jgi:hypothetical protein
LLALAKAKVKRNNKVSEMETKNFLTVTVIILALTIKTLGKIPNKTTYKTNLIEKKLLDSE